MRRKEKEASKVKNDCTCVHVYIICLCGRPILLHSDTSNSGTPEVSEVKCNGDGRLDVTIRIEVCTVCSIQSLVGNPAPWAGGCAREPSTLGRRVC